MPRTTRGLPFRLEILTDDPGLAELVREYWEIDAERSFVRSAKDVYKRYNALGYRGTFSTSLRTIARAVVENVSCSGCGGEVAVNNRSSLDTLTNTLSFVRGFKPTCQDCDEKRVKESAAAAKELAAATEKARLDELARLRIEVEKHAAEAEKQDFWVDYSTIPFDVGMKLSAYDAWSGYSLASKGGIPYRAGLITPTANGSTNALSALYRGNLLIRPAPDPDFGISGFDLSNEKGDFSWSWVKASTVLVPHVTGSRHDALAIAYNRLPDTKDEGVALWRECAAESCLAYLNLQVVKSGLFYLEEDDLLNAKRSFAVALENYSVAQVWSIAWKCVRDAASLCAQPYYSNQKATGTIPGKIERAVQAARASQRDVPAYNRTEEHEISELEIVFRDRFGIGERTSPADVDAIFERVVNEARRSDVNHGTATEGRFSPVELDVALRKVLPEKVYTDADDVVEAMKIVAFIDFAGCTPEELRDDFEIVRNFARRFMSEWSEN